MLLHDYILGLIALLLTAAFILVAVYLCAPFKIRHQQVKDMNVDYRPIELPNLPSTVAQAFVEATRGLVTCGFHAVGHLTRYIGKTSQNSYVSVWVNPSSRDEAQVIGVCTPSPLHGISVVTLVTFRTEFSDGTAIATSNTSSPGVYPRDPKVSAVRCPGIRDFTLLYRFHRARVERDRGARTATLHHVNDARTRMENEWNQTCLRLVAANYYSIDEARQQYVPTLKGAFFMTYRLLPPFTQIQKLRRDRLAERTLRELGFGGLGAFRKAQSQPIPACVPSPEPVTGAAHPFPSSAEGRA